MDFTVDRRLHNAAEEQNVLVLELLQQTRHAIALLPIGALLRPVSKQGGETPALLLAASARNTRDRIRDQLRPFPVRHSWRRSGFHGPYTGVEIKKNFADAAPCF